MSRNIIIASTDVYIHDPDAIDYLRDGDNVLVIPISVIEELEKLSTKPDFGVDARLALEKMDHLRSQKDPNIKVVHRVDYSGMDNIRNSPFNHIIAVVKNQFSQKEQISLNCKVKLVTGNSALRLIARELCNPEVVVEEYRRDMVGPLANVDLKVIDVDGKQIDANLGEFAYDEKFHGDIGLNDGVICNSNYIPHVGITGENYRQAFAAIRRRRKFVIVPPDINIFGLKPTSINSKGVNWTQHIAMQHLIDPDIPLTFLEGDAGTGKTLLALAAAFDLRNDFDNITISRPMVPLEDRDRMGFLPGDEQEKISPWMRPIMQAIDFLANLDSNNKKIIENMRKAARITFESLDYVRGSTFHHRIVIIDEAQNCTPHMVRTIITRAGPKTKLILTGDLNQIDRNMVSAHSSGLAYAIKRMRGHHMVSHVHFLETVRSPLASLAKDLL